MPIQEASSRRLALFIPVLAALLPIAAEAAPARAPAAHRNSVITSGGLAMTVLVAPVVVQSTDVGKRPTTRVIEGAQTLTRNWRGAGVYRAAPTASKGSRPAPAGYRVSLNYN